MEEPHTSHPSSEEATNSPADTPTSPNPQPSISRIGSGEIHEEPAHDSMVTIRLSSIPGSRKSVTFSPVVSSDHYDDESTLPKVELKRHSTAMEPFPTVKEETAEEEAASREEQQEEDTTDEQDEEDSDSSNTEPDLASLGSPSLHEDFLNSPTRDAKTLSVATMAPTEDDFGQELTRASVLLSRSGSHSSVGSRSSVGSNDSANRVDWAQLDRNEEAEIRDEASDESTAFLLARLERENQLLVQDPKSQMSKARTRGQSRPPSLQQLKKMANGPNQSNLRYSLLPTPPPMTELEFWSALVRDYAQTAQRLPTLTSNKIRSGIPPPLRGVVWVSIAGARDPHLEEEYERLCGESSPYEKLIGKDIGRSFPGVDMFRDPDGEGQQMLGKVLNAYSLWDQEIGYCQGLGFVVGPLIMHMSDKDAFCVLVKLMQSYDLRNCFLPDLSGLHLRIYQFQHLLKQHLPDLTAHLEKLKVEPLYVSQWFLSFFGVNCPLPMLIRIYDILLTEGASETLMRVALSLMRRNEKKILTLTEFEDVMGLLLSRGLWDTYDFNADDLVNDFVGWTGLVTRDGLLSLEESFKEQGNEEAGGKSTQKVESAASRFLGRFWPTSSSSSPAGSPNNKQQTVTSPTLSTPTGQTVDGVLKRTPSKQSMASTLNSIDSIDSMHTQSTTATDASNTTRQQSDDFKQGATAKSNASIRSMSSKDKDLHSQIEDLLMAMNDLQREHADLANELQREREERDEDKAVVGRVIERLKKRDAPTSTPEEDRQSISDESDTTVTEDPISELEHQFVSTKSKRSSLMLSTKMQLRDEVIRWKNQYNEEVSRSTTLSNQLTDRERESKEMKDQLREARSRLADQHRERQRLEKVNRDLRDKPSNSPRGSMHISGADSATPTPKPSGLREFKLGRSNTAAPAVSSARDSVVFNKRTSSLSMQSIVVNNEEAKSGEEKAAESSADREALLSELVQAKTSEAVARQELEECKAKLDGLRKMLSGKSNPGAFGHSAGSLSIGGAIGLTKSEMTKKEEDKKDDKKPPTPSAGGWFSGSWGKRAVSGTGS